MFTTKLVVTTITLVTITSTIAVFITIRLLTHPKCIKVRSRHGKHYVITKTKFIIVNKLPVH